MLNLGSKINTSEEKRGGIKICDIKEQLIPTLFWFQLFYNFGISLGVKAALMPKVK